MSIELPDYIEFDDNASDFIKDFLDNMEAESAEFNVEVNRHGVSVSVIATWDADDPNLHERIKGIEDGMSDSYQKEAQERDLNLNVEVLSWGRGKAKMTITSFS